MRKPPPPFGNQELLAALIAISICGCSGSQRIGDGAFQKRMHRPGWHVDLGWRTDVEPPGSNARQPITPTPLAFTATEKNVEPITAISRDVKNPILFVTTNKTASHESSEVSTAKTSRSAADDPPESRHRGGESDCVVVPTYVHHQGCSPPSRIPLKSSPDRPDLIDTRKAGSRSWASCGLQNGLFATGCGAV